MLSLTKSRLLGKKLFIFILLLTTLCLWAQNVPQTIDYQGRLADSDGNYLNGIVTVNFLIFNVEIYGTPLWIETQDVSTANGIFHVQLGAVTAFPGTLFDGADRWLELVVGGETLAPRTAIASVPFAIKAETAYTVEVPLNLSGNVSWPDGVIKADATGTGCGVYGSNSSYGNFGVLGHLDNGVYARTSVSGGSGVYGQSDVMNGYGIYGSNVYSNNFGYIGGSNYGVYGNSSSGWAGYFDGKMYVNDMVGIGTINPGRMLTVNSTGANPIQWQVNSLILGQLGTNGSGAGGLYLYDNGLIATVVTASGNSYFNGGNVGIGTDTPPSKLTVAGTIESTSGGIKFPDGTIQTTAATGSTTYSIGESYGGGIIFYVTPDGQHGLIVETQDQSTSCTWYEAQNTISTSANHSTAGKNYTDWRLPTKNELNLLYLQKDVVGGFASVYYWSSTEYDSNDAWLQLFGSGYQASTTKTYAYYVRAVRAF